LAGVVAVWKQSQAVVSVALDATAAPTQWLPDEDARANLTHVLRFADSRRAWFHTPRTCSDAERIAERWRIAWNEGTAMSNSVTMTASVTIISINVKPRRGELECIGSSCAGLWNDRGPARGKPQPTGGASGQTSRPVPYTFPDGRC
jgi:hypothetical protein